MLTPTEANRLNWNERVDVHQEATDHYDIEAFKKGACTLKEPELAAFGDVKGKTLLHLQCHFGLDTLSWARRGAIATGVDFSPKAVARAQELSAETGINAEFVESDVLELNLNRQFDYVIASYGVLCWLSDLGKWGEVVARHLKPGGKFFLIDMHPVANMLEPADPSEKTSPLQVEYGYFNEGVRRFENEYSYAGKQKMTHSVQYEWAHGMGEILNALTGAGLNIEKIEEMPELFFLFWKHLVPARKNWWKLPEGVPSLPLTLAVTAVKRADQPA